MRVAKFMEGDDRLRQALLNRRAVLGASASVAFLALPGIGQAVPRTGVRALDTASIPVRSPARALLVAITRTPANRLVAVGAHGVVIYSDDNGTSWTQASVPVDVTLTCVAFATARIGWAAGHFGAILKTQDGGASWVRQLDGLQANQLTLRAAQDPAVTTEACPCAPLALRRAEHFVADGPDKPFLCMLVLSPLHVMVFGAYRMAMVTTDGGTSWADWSLHIYDQYSHNIYGAAVIGGAYYLVGEQGLVFRATDGGTTFLPVTPPSAITLFGILGARDGSLIAYGVAGTCFRSTDGGQTWTSIVLAVQDNITAGRVVNSGDVLLISEAGALFQSTDNGARFSAVPSAVAVPFFDLEQAADDRLVVVGAAGVTRFSADHLNG